MANERFIVTAENAKAIGRLVINTPTRYPIIYEPKSGLNLFQKVLPSYFEVPTGKVKTGLDRLATLGCLTWLKTGKAITEFKILDTGNDGIAGGDITGTIDETEHTIAVTVPAGSTVTALKATFTLSSGATAKVGTTAQVSGTTANDFSEAVTYTITAEDKRTQEYVVTVTVAE